MRTFFFISVLVLLAGALAACGGGSAEPVVPADSGSTGEVNIAVETNPNPAAMGDVELVLTITDAQGNAIEGATVDVEVDHTDMTGMGMNGAATDQGGGRYSINANFSMSGNWKLTVYVRKDGLDVQQDIDLKIQ
jgi:hypothetical protein